MAPYNESAFPIPEIYRESGMTLRDYFAGRALAVLIHDLDSGIDGDKRCSRKFKFIVQEAYRYSDAMLVERTNY